MKHKFNSFYKKLKPKGKIHNTEQIVSIVTDIAYHNPRTIPVCCAIISKLLDELDNPKPIAKLVYQKLSRMPNSGFTQIWLQRMLKAELNNYSFSEEMCKLQKISLWNNKWVKGKNMLNILNNTPIFQQDKFDELSNVISNDEIDEFTY